MTRFAAILAIWTLIQGEAKAAGVSPLTFAAIVHVESRGQPGAIKHEANGSCSVGLGQVNVSDCDEAAVTRLLVPAANLRAAAGILKAGARYCLSHRCPRGGAVAMYNAGDKGYARRVFAVRRQLRRAVVRWPTR